MSDRAAEFLTTWSLKRDDIGPISPDEAHRVAARWESEAAENGIDPAALEAAAGGGIADYLLRTFGEAGDEFEV